MRANTEVEINEEKIDRLLHLLHEADPSNPEQDTQEMLCLEGEVNSMGPLIDAELERVDRKHAQLTQLSTDLVEALNLYHTLMREPQYGSLPKGLPYGATAGYGAPPMYAPGGGQTYVPYPGPVMDPAPQYAMPPPPGYYPMQQQPPPSHQQMPPPDQYTHG